MPDTTKDELTQQLLQHLKLLYPNHESKSLTDRILAAIEPFRGQPGSNATQNRNAQNRGARSKVEHSLSESDCLLISYGDSLVGGGRGPLQNLKHFLDVICDQQISHVHILPFYPYSSDDGFSVTEYLAVREDLGNWPDVEAIAGDYALMADLVINHVSSESEWFKQFCNGEREGFFVEASSTDDLSQVVRPRATPLLRPTETPSGMKQVWCTFSHDQVDVNFKNPDVLIEYLKIIGNYLQHGAKLLRLDAIGYLWKETGTTCIHLPETHEVVRLIRNVCSYLSPGTMLITETNVPNHENLTYFGNRNEAHAIYNFSLPPLLVHGLLTGESKHLKHWMMSMPPSPDGCFYLNFTASHDGVGMRPAEGLLSNQEQLQVVETIRTHGGLFSTRRAADGSERVYELNISLFDALKGDVDGPDEFGIDRFICSQSVMLSIEGVPAFYVHSLLATPNDNALVEKTGRSRSINRHQWDVDELRDRLDDKQSNQSIVLNELLRRIQIRSRQPAFHPNATQFTLHLNNEGFFAYWRQSRDRMQSIFVVNNLTKTPQVLRLSDLNLIGIDNWADLISGVAFDELHADVIVAPYQSLWIANRDGA